MDPESVRCMVPELAEGLTVQEDVLRQKTSLRTIDYASNRLDP